MAHDGPRRRATDVTPLVSVWLDDAAHVTTGPGEQQAVNWAATAMTGCRSGTRAAARHRPEVPQTPSPTTLPGSRQLALHGADELARRRRHDPDDHPSNHPAARPEADPQPASARWNALYRSAAAAALITAVLIPIQIAVFIAYPFPDTVTGWFALLQHDPLPGLVDLDLLLVVDNVLLVVIALALYVALRGVSPSITLMATGLWLLAIAMFITANPAVGLLGLSDRFAAATTEAQRSAALAAGQALLAGWEGTAFQVSYVLGQLAGIVVGVVMLRGSLFGRAAAVVLIAGNVLGFGYYLPRVGLAVSAFSGVVLWVWYLLIARALLRLGRGRAPSMPSARPGEESGQR